MNYSPETVYEAFAELSQYMFDWLRPDAISVVVEARGASRVLGYTSTGYGADGIALPMTIDDLAPRVEAVRAAMYMPGTGTWFSARIIVTREGVADAEYNYDDEPHRGRTMDTVEWVRDLRRYPRDAANLPEWLLDAVADAYRRFPGIRDADIAAGYPWAIAADRITSPGGHLAEFGGVGVLSLNNLEHNLNGIIEAPTPGEIFIESAMKSQGNTEIPEWFEVRQVVTGSDTWTVDEFDNRFWG